MKIIIQINKDIALEVDSSMCDDRQLVSDTLKACCEFADGKKRLGELLDVVQQSHDDQDRRALEKRKLIEEQADKYVEKINEETVAQNQISMEV